MEWLNLIAEIFGDAILFALTKYKSENDIFDDWGASSEKTVVFWKPFLGLLMMGLLLTAGGFLLVFVLGGWGNLLSGRPWMFLIGVLMLLSGIFFCGRSLQCIHPSTMMQYYGYHIKKGIIYGFWIPFPFPLFFHMYQAPFSQYWREEIFPGILKMIVYGPVCSIIGVILGVIIGILYARHKLKIKNSLEVANDLQHAEIQSARRIRATRSLRN